ncbi:MAG: glucose-1-phosphate adenylyltransferase [Ignavibacteriales bacterium]|nr:glucose-1-phosphate adenylyltransferase [Ignavibacteriales bacterium]
MKDTVAIILGGGRGERLYPLTKLRAKPALPLAGKYRLIDIPVSNCINSNIHKIFVLTQFNSASLNRHVSTTYGFSPFMKGFVEVLAAQQTTVSPDWFQGTADAVRKILWVIEPQKANDLLILAGDHLYKMDYRLFVKAHRESNADVSIAVIPVSEADASGFGLMKIDVNGRVVEFKEKPKGDELKNMQVDVTSLGFVDASTWGTSYLASMGIYLFKNDVITKLLERYPQHTDFGKHLIPEAINDFKVQSYIFRGYWEDIGTIESFYRANLALVKQPNPDFSFFDEQFPIYTRPRFLPPSKILNSKVEQSMISDGCIILCAKIVNSVIGVRTRVEEKSHLENVLMMGADYHQSAAERDNDIKNNLPPIGIGENSLICNSIIDKNARIGKNVKIINKNKIQHLDSESNGYCIRNGITIIVKNAIIPDNTII